MDNTLIKKVVIRILAGTLCLLTLSGCSFNPKDLLNKDKEEPVEESLITPEMEALIGTKDAYGNTIVGYDENGWAITEEPSVEEVMSDELGADVDTLLSQQKVYPNIVITVRNTSSDTPIYVESDKVDASNRTAEQYIYSTIDYYDAGNSHIYYDNKSTTRYSTSVKTNEWSKQSGSKLENLNLIIDPAEFTQNSVTMDDSFIYIDGTVNLRSIKMDTIQKLLMWSMTSNGDIPFFAMYDKDTFDVFRMTFQTPTHSISVIADTEPNTIAIPSYVIQGKTAAEVIYEEVTHMPLTGYLMSALYLDKSKELSREYLIDEYKFSKSALEKEYGGIDIEVFLTDMETKYVDMSIEEFLGSYTFKKDGSYDSTEEQAEYEIMYNRLVDLDANTNEEYINAIELKPPKVELTPEQLALIGTDDGNGIIKDFDADGNPIYEEKEEVELGPTMISANTGVNKRSGPGTQYDKAGKLEAGDTAVFVKEAEEDPTWYECQDAQGNTFYVKSEYVTIIEPKPVSNNSEEQEEQEEQGPAETTEMKATGKINKRLGPGTQYDKAGQLSPNEKVSVIGPADEDPGWSKCIDASGNIFYVKSTYLIP